MLSGLPRSDRAIARLRRTMEGRCRVINALRAFILATTYTPCAALLWQKGGCRVVNALRAFILANNIYPLRGLAIAGG